MAFAAFVPSLLGGGAAAMFNPGRGAAAPVSVAGAFIVYSLNKE